MSDDDLYDIHPLDRDYTSDHQRKAKRRPIIASKRPYDTSLRRIGVIVFAIGFVALAGSAIVIGSVRSNTSAESIAATVNRLGMFVMLFGAVAIMSAYRRNEVDVLESHSERKR